MINRREFIAGLSATFILLQSEASFATAVTEKNKSDIDAFRNEAAELLKNSTWKKKLEEFKRRKFSAQELQEQIAKDYSGELHKVKNWWMSETEVLLLLSVTEQMAKA